MVLSDLQKGLSSFAEELSSQTYLNTFRTQRRDSLLAEGLGTRANSIWKMAQYIIATYDDKKDEPIESYINGWKTLVKNYKNQFLIIAIDDAGNWEMYDSYSKLLGGNDYIKAFFSSHTPKNDNSLQKIYYGAPGTGKSHKISEDKDVKVATAEDLVFRTTFHPDTDYASFVGCYKPKTHKKSMIDGNGINETQLLSCFFDSNSSKYKGENKARYLYEALVHTKDIKDLGLDAQAIADKLKTKGFSSCAYTTEATCMFNIYKWLKEDGYIVENKLSYEFTPQCFVKAYIEAWKHQQSGDPVFLIIEEINRGNCAQIFGDLFQLLDRDNNGFSRYEISPDSDLQEYISGIGLDIANITDTDGNDISAKIASGELMKLPNNLYIWATMNTSDQSLFPIDSAFKRRWEWKYIKITKPEDKNWELEDGTKWWDFLQMINAIIASMTSSADKQLGYFFCKPDKDNNTISYERFVNKVVFYLWNDVFKDYAMDEGKLFKFIPRDKDGKDMEERDLTYPDFYDDINGKEQNYVVKQFIDHVMNWKKDEKKA